MSKYEKDVFRVGDAEQLRAIGSPVRLRIVELFLARGPLTVVELGVLIDRQPQALYYHIKKLCDVGLVVVDQVEKSSRRDQIRYKLVAKKLKLDFQNATNEMRDALGATASTLLRAAERDFKSAVQDPKLVITGKDRNLFCRRLQVRMNKKTLRRFNRLVAEIETLIDENEVSDTATEYSITINLSKTG